MNELEQKWWRICIESIRAESNIITACYNATSAVKDFKDAQRGRFFEEVPKKS